MSTAADFAGRTFDVVAFQGVRPSGDTRLVNSLTGPNDDGSICTGVDKLAQRWLIEFLTITGTLEYLPTRGCQFMYLVQTGQLRTTLDAEQAFYLSNDTVRSNLQAEEDTSDPDDERFDSAALLYLIVSGDSIKISVQISSLAGTSRKAILPITTVVSSAVNA